MTENDDPIYSKAVQFMQTRERTGTQDLQRAFCIGYNRAARLIEQMIEDRVAERPDKNEWYGIRPVGKSEGVSK